MSSAAARVLKLFLQTSQQGVAGVTNVTGHSVTPKNQAVTMVTPVTSHKQQGREYCVASAQSGGLVTPEQTGIHFEERAAVVEYDGGASRAWAEALARLDPAHPPGDVPPKRWLRFIDDCGRFLDDGWAAYAERLGWGPLDLFGCDRTKPFARISRAGLLWLLNGRRLLALAADTAAIATASGGYFTFRRRFREPGGVLAWELPFHAA